MDLSLAMKMFHEFRMGDALYSARSLLKDWYFSLNFIVVLCFGIAALLYTYNIYYSFLIKPIDYSGDQDLYIIGSKVNGALQSEPGITYSDFARISSEKSPFRELGFYRTDQIVASVKEEKYLLNISTVGGEFFNLFSLNSKSGYFFDNGGRLNGAELLAVITEDLWSYAYSLQRLGDNIYIDINNQIYRVVGVVPRGFRFPNSSDVWINGIKEDDDRDIFIFGLLDDSRTLRDADLFVKNVFSSKNALNEELKRKTEYIVSNIKDYFWGPRSTRVIYIQLVSSIFVFFLSLINVCGLFITRQESRKHFLMIRRSVGSTKLGLANIFVYESAILVLISSVLAYFFASYMLEVGLNIIKLSEPEAAFVWSNPRIDVRSHLLILIAVVSSIVFASTVSYLKVGKKEIYQTLKDTQGNSGGRKGRSFKSIIIFIEIFLSTFIVSVACVLIFISFETNEGEYGLDFDNLYSLKVYADDNSFRSHKERKGFLNEFLNNVKGNQEVRASAIFSSLPTENVYTGAVKTNQSDVVVEAKRIATSEGFAEVLGTKILYGRDFNGADIRDSDLVVVVSKSFAEAFWPDSISSAIGNKIKFVSRSGKESREHTIVGITQNVLFGKPFGDAKDAPVIFVHYLQRKDNENVAMMIKFKNIIQLDGLRKIKDMVSSHGTVYNFEPMSKGAAKIIGTQVFLKWLIVSFGICSLAIAFNGIYSLVLLDVQSRKKDIGIMKALGLKYLSVVRHILGSLSLVSIIAVILGLSCSIFIGSIFISYYGVSSYLYMVTFPIVLVIILLVIVAAMWLPTYGAFKANTARVLSDQG